MNLFMKQKQTQETQKINIWLPKGREVRGGQIKSLGLADTKYKLLYIKQINNKYLLYNTGKYIQCFIITYNGNNLKKYKTESLQYIPEANKIL